MAYGDNTLNADHRWSFNNVLTDSIGSITLTNSGGSFVTTPLVRDATHSYQTNGRDDIATGTGDINTGNGASLSQYAVGGWFRVSDIQGPPCTIYKQGGATAGLGIFLWAGNNVMCQFIVNSTPILQIFSNTILTSNRPYHLLAKFSDNANDNEVTFYIDGVKQTANGGSIAPGASMVSHTSVLAWGENGTTGTEFPVGTESVLVKAPVNGFFNEWWTWNGTDADLSENDIREHLFASGALADLTISASTEAGMQSQLSLIDSTERPDWPLCILVEEVTGGGNLNLSASNVTFNSRASIHVRYEGSGSLNWTNDGTSNAVSGSGNVVFLNPAQLTINNIQNPTEVRVYEAGTQTEIVGVESVTTGSFSATISTSPVDIRFLSLGYQISKLSSIDVSSDLTIDVQQFLDRQYENP